MTFVLSIVAPKQPSNTVDFAPFFTHTISIFILGVGDFNENPTYQDKLKTLDCVPIASWYIYALPFSCCLHHILGLR